MNGCTPPCILDLALVRCEWSASRPDRFTPGTHRIGIWVGPEIGVDATKKRIILTIPEIELRPLGYTDNSIPGYLEGLKKTTKHTDQN
jgi:hypothetical protein